MIRLHVSYLFSAIFSNFTYTFRLHNTIVDGISYSYFKTISCVLKLTHRKWKLPNEMNTDMLGNDGGGGHFSLIVDDK